MPGASEHDQPTRRRALAGQLAFDLSMLCLNAALAVPSHPWRRLVLRRLAGVELGRDVSIARGVRLTVRRSLRIGDRCIVESGSVLDARGGLWIGADTNIAPEVRVLTADHDPGSPEFAGRRRPVRIGARSWIATRAIVLPGTTLGEGVVVAAGSVVRGEVPAWTVVAGHPARRIADRPRDAQRRLKPHRRFFG
jgi:acetyltransferase-like isoleucine patch superfamily enzyme